MDARRLRDPYDRVWSAFQESESTIDGRHDTPEWRAHSGPYAACVVRIPAGVLQPALDQLRHDLTRLGGVRLHPDHFLHVMLQELGFVVEIPGHADELTAARLEEFAQATARAMSSLSSLKITIGGVNSFQDAVFLEVAPSSPLTEIHERLFDLAAIPKVPRFAYLPHCTIAHYTGGMLTSDAVGAIEPWRNALCGEAAISEIEIVTIDPREPYPELKSYAVIPMG